MSKNLTRLFNGPCGQFHIRKFREPVEDPLAVVSEYRGIPEGSGIDFVNMDMFRGLDRYGKLGHEFPGLWKIRFVDAEHQREIGLGNDGFFPTPASIPPKHKSSAPRPHGSFPCSGGCSPGYISCRRRISSWRH